MSAFRKTLDFFRGDDWTVVLKMTSDGSTPLNITGRTYSMQMRTSTEATTLTATFTCTVTASDEVTCTVSDTVTAGVNPGTYVYDIQENASGTISTVGYGTIKVHADVTR